MARRVPLPRLTNRQRTSRWQRERRQQAIVVTVFTAVLVFVLGLAAWAASERYYNANLTAAAEVEGRSIAKRDFLRQAKYEYVRLYLDYGVPPGFENDQQIAGAKSQYDDYALEHVVEQRVLDLEAAKAGIRVTPAQIDDQYEIEFGQFRVRHVLIAVAKDATDKEAAENTAKAKARAIAALLRSAPMDQDLWNKVAAESSEDPGSQFSGGELGFAGKGQYVPEFEDAIRTLPVGQISDPVKTQFGYHVLQVEEKKAPADSDTVKKYLYYGFTVADLKQQARYEFLRKQFGKQQQDALLVSPTEQVHLAQIVIGIPTPTSGDFQKFTDALKKQTDARTALESGKDFAEVATQFSEDTETKDKGGDIGWVTRGMIASPAQEQVVFSTEPGKTTEPVSTTTQWTVYKILEKQTREIDAEQKTKVGTGAYQYWLQRQKKAYDVHKYVTGLSVD